MNGRGPTTRSLRGPTTTITMVMKTTTSIHPDPILQVASYPTHRFFWCCLVLVLPRSWSLFEGAGQIPWWIFASSSQLLVVPPKGWMLGWRMDGCAAAPPEVERVCPWKLTTGGSPTGSCSSSRSHHWKIWCIYMNVYPSYDKYT